MGGLLIKGGSDSSENYDSLRKLAESVRKAERYETKFKF